MKQQIKELIENKKEISLKDIYSNFDNISKPKIRSTLNFLVNNGIIQRLERGKYKSNE